jgi:hypothetical protein
MSAQPESVAPMPTRPAENARKAWRRVESNAGKNIARLQFWDRRIGRTGGQPQESTQGSADWMATHLG